MCDRLSVVGLEGDILSDLPTPVTDGVLPFFFFGRGVNLERLRIDVKHTSEKSESKFDSGVFVWYVNRMNFPSIKTLLKLGITRDEAKQIREAMLVDDRGLTVANEVLKAHGVESIGLPDGCFDRCEQPEVDIQYVNRGDTYDITLMKVNGHYRVGSWGDEVEAFDNRR
jgi:hypothetical protein